jgi:predicted Zn finger-like uncharacterized protein
MIVECSNCHTKYNVNEEKIPATGVRVKCHKCQAIIVINRPATDRTTAERPAHEPARPQPTRPPVPERPVAPSAPREAPVSDRRTEPPVQERPTPAAPKPSPPPAAPPEAPSETPPSEAPRFEDMSEEDKKWHQRARRLAKALASDLVLYNQDKVERGLRDGTLAQLLGSEIRRSWEYYCQQVPEHIVKNTDYFKELLNKIVGKGKEIFK